MKRKDGAMDTTSAAAATPAPEGFTDAEFQKFERFQAEKERRRIAAERFKAGLSTERLLFRNETGNPRNLPYGCTLDAHDLAKEIRCDGLDPACRLRASKPVAAAGELFWMPPGHHQGAINPALPEIDPASVADGPTVQDRLALSELRAAKEAVERPAIQAEKTEADLEAQERILAERKLQQRAEVRRRSHVQAAEVRINEFLSSRSEAWRTTILGGAAEASLESVRQAADADRGHVGTMDQLRRSQAGDVGGPAAFMSGASGQPVKLPVDRSS